MIDWKELSNEMRQAMPDLKILDEEPLARHTSFRIGGPAAIFAQPATVEALSELLKFLAARGISPRILGAGTNVLAPDEGLREVVICTKDALTGLRDLGDGKIEAFAVSRGARNFAPDPRRGNECAGPGRRASGGRDLHKGRADRAL